MVENMEIEQLGIHNQMLASCLGALFTSLTMTPLDVVKIRMQAQKRILSSKKCFLYCNGLMDHLCTCVNGMYPPPWYKRQGHFTGTLDAFVKIARYEGITSLWSGLPPTLVMAVPATMIYFTAYENLKWSLSSYYNLDNRPVWIPLMAGMLARTWAVVLVSPLEMIRTKMQSKRMKYIEMGSAIRFLIQTEGFRGLWKGLLPSLLRDVPFSGIYWFHYEILHHILQERTNGLWVNFISGAISGMIAATVTLPFDVIKTHRQIQLGESALSPGPSFTCRASSDMLLIAEHPESIHSFRTICLNIYQQYGVRGFYAGLVPRLFKVVPACAIMITSYEFSKQQLRELIK